MKIFKKIILAILVILTVALAYFFYDMNYVRYYKIEKISPEKQLALDFFDLLKSKQSLTNEEFERFFGDIANAENKRISKDANSKLFEKFLAEFKSLNLPEQSELYIYSSCATVKNDNLEIASERVYDKRVFVEVRNMFETQRESLENKSPLIIFSVRSSKVDLPIEFRK